MKCWWAYIPDEDWGVFIHGETSGKAKQRAMRCSGFDWYDFIDIHLRREPKLDNINLTYKNMIDVGRMYLNFESEPTEFIPEYQFVNDCDCEICKGSKE